MRQKLAAVISKTQSWVKSNPKPSIALGGAGLSLLTVISIGTFALDADNANHTKPLAEGSPFSTLQTTNNSSVTPAPDNSATTVVATPADPNAPATTAAPNPATPATPNSPAPAGATPPAPAQPARPSASPITRPAAPAPNPISTQNPLSIPPVNLPARELTIQATDVTDTFLPEDPRVAIEVTGADTRGFITRVAVNWQSGDVPEARTWALQECSNGNQGFTTSNRKERFEHAYPEGGIYNVVIAVTSSDCDGGNERTSYARVNLVAASNTSTTTTTPTTTVSTPSTPLQLPLPGA